MAAAQHVTAGGDAAPLKVLDDAGLTVSEKRGRVRWRRLNAEALAAAEAWIGDRRRLWNTRLGALERHLKSDPSDPGGN